MTDFSKKSRNSSDLRKQHNGDLIRRMRNGESLNAIDSKASWFPPRPVIEKDKNEMARVYDTAAAPKDELSKKRDEKIVPFTPMGNAS